MLIKWFLNALGIFIYFLTRYINRTDRAKEPSRAYWWRDNWPELIIILMFDVALMLLVIVGGVQLNFEKIFPAAAEWLTFTGDAAAAFIIGLLLSHMIYQAYKVFIKKRLKKD